MESSFPITAVTDADPPFDVQHADIILRSTDNVDFKTFKCLLSFASPFFEAMFSLPQHSSNDEIKDGLPVVQVPECSEALRTLLLFCHPGCAPVLPDLRQFPTILGPAIKYDMQGVVARIRSMLIAPQFIEKEPLRVFAIATRFNLDDEAILAAKQTLNFPFFPRKYELELEDITAGALHRLQTYHYRCGKAAKAVANSFAWILLDNFLQFGIDCWECNDGETVTVAAAAQLSARRWWIEYMNDASNALGERPCGATVKRTDIVGTALKKASQCPNCRERAFVELKEFAEAFATEVESAVSTVSVSLIIRYPRAQLFSGFPATPPHPA
jgi:hypothetical protein